MCGIWGLTTSGYTSAADDKFLHQAAICGEVRGTHATGFVVLNNKECNVYKKAVPGSQFVNEHVDITKAVPANTKVVIGHNRAATVGASDNDDYAHPFIEKNLVGVHNGSLIHGWEGRLQVSAKTPVDSMGLYRAIRARGIDFAAEKAEGAMALVWIDTNTDRTYVLRNAERPLHYAESRADEKGHDPGRLYFASEKGMLEWLLKRNKIAHSPIQSFKTEVLYDISDGIADEVRRVPINGTWDMADWEEYGYRGNYQPGNYVPPVTQQGATPTTTTTTGYVKDGKIVPFKKKEDTTSSEQPEAGGHGGYNRDGGSNFGISYRGCDLPPEDIANGIEYEYAEKDAQILHCDCCGGAIYGETNYLEEAHPLPKDEAIIIHEECLNDFRVSWDPALKFMRIKRRNTSNRSHAV
jgi:predicted glutamine amidotransferase